LLVYTGAGPDGTKRSRRSLGQIEKWIVTTFQAQAQKEMPCYQLRSRAFWNHEGLFWLPDLGSNQGPTD